MPRRVRVVLLIATFVAIGFVGVQPTDAVTVDETDFTRGVLAGAGFMTALPTALTVGPDGRLFVADQEGRIQALTLDPKTKAVTAVEEITTNADLQEVFGIAFDPTDASLPPPVYVTNTVSGFGAAGPAPAGSFPGKVTKIHGAGYSTITDIITGLSTSDSAHQANGIVFAADGTLYIAHGSTTNAGVETTPGFGLFERPDVPLSGAILFASPNSFVFDGNVTYDPPGTYSSTVNLVTGDVFVFASGLRNPYDLVLHSNGKLYATDNGPNAGLGGSSTSCTTEDPDPWAPDTRGPDELNLIEAGKYYGQPNRNRARFDARQCIYHNGLDGSGVDWTGPIDLLPVSSNGIAEYTSAGFGGKLAGDLFYVALLDGTVGRIVLSPDGLSVVSNTTFASSFVFPLDIAIDADGTLYIAEFGGNQITFMQPKPVPVGGVSLEGGLRALSNDSSGSLWLNGWLLAVAVAAGTVALVSAAWRQRSGQR